jgi:N,N-dimethylformamidase
MKPVKPLIGYCDPLSVRPGDSLRFMVSCDTPGPYRAEIARVRGAGCTWEGALSHVLPGMGARFEKIADPVPAGLPGRAQPIDPGSYAWVPWAGALAGCASFTAAAWLWPTLPGRGEQVIAATWSPLRRAGFALLLDADGSLALQLGDGNGRSARVRSGAALAERRWTLVAASFDAASGRVCLAQRPLADGPFADLCARPASLETRVDPRAHAPHAGPLVFAGWIEADSPRRVVAAHWNGRLEAPRLARAAVDVAALDAHAILRALAPGAPTTVGAWDFALGIGGERIHDLSANGLHGETVNLPTRAVPGHAWSGREPAWTHAPAEYAAIHFHDDDLYDAGWEPDFAWTVPPELPSGVYAARLVHASGEDDVPFFVLPPRGRATSELAFLAPTASYLAYANTWLHMRRHTIFGDPTTDPIPLDALLVAHPEFGLSQYDHHADGHGVVVSSRLRPIVNLKCDAAPWGFAADVQITRWLERSGRSFDVLTDEDLHAEGAALLAPYRVLVTGSHPEYWSTAMLDALEAWLAAGGRLVYLGGNGFYWRIAFHPERPGAIEVRRAEDGTRAWIAEPGESYHAWTGEYGGLWRRLGRAPNRLVGVGFAAQGLDRGVFRRTPASRDPRAAFVFRGVEREVIGADLLVGPASLEIDRCDARLGSPPHALVLARSERHDRTQMLRTKEELFETELPGDDPAVRADMTFFEGPNGGAVFSVGAISWSLGLAAEDGQSDVARITHNVLERFLDPTAFPPPPRQPQ